VTGNIVGSLYHKL